MTREIDTFPAKRETLHFPWIAADDARYEGDDRPDRFRLYLEWKARQKYPEDDGTECICADAGKCLYCTEQAMMRGDLLMDRMRDEGR